MSLRELWGLIRVRAVRCEDFQRGSKVNFCDKHAWADFKSRCIRADKHYSLFHSRITTRVSISSERCMSAKRRCQLCHV